MNALRSDTADAGGPPPDAWLVPTKQRLLLEAEKVFGEQGIANASLREIAERAGHRNKSAAQYHFGNRDGLILAILRHRRPHIDRMRRRFFEKLGQSVAQAPPQLLVEALVGPMLFGNVTAQLHDYARTVFALLHHDLDGEIWAQSGDAAPFTREIYAALRRHAAGISDGVWSMRQRTFGRCLVDLTANRAAILPGGEVIQPHMTDELVAMLTAILIPADSRQEAGDAHRIGVPFRTNCAVWQTIGYNGDSPI